MALGSASPARSKPQLLPLTGIRFFAAFHVVVYHHAEYLMPAVPEWLGFLGNYLHTGYSGVNLFFVLSGFILAYTYLQPEEEAAVDSRRFWLARFARIYPVYLLSLLVIVPIVVGHFVATNPPGVAALKSAVSAASALSLLHAWVPPLRGIWNPPGWTLSVEAFFYALFPFLVGPIWRLGRRGALVLAGAAWLAGQLPPLLWMAWSRSPEALASAVDTSLVGTQGSLIAGAPLARLHEFVFGIALARAYFPRAEARDAVRGRRGSAIALLGILGLFVALAFADRIPRALMHSGILDPLYGLLIVGLAHGSGRLPRLFSGRWLQVLGESSYGIYVLHFPIKYWMERAVGLATAERLGVAYFVGYAAIVVAVSVAVFTWLEDPARRWIRRRFSGRPAPA